MSKQFFIGGAIVDNDLQKSQYEDVTPTQFNSFIKGLEDNEDVELIVCSPGGSVTAGIAIAAAIQRAQSKGHRFTAKIEGICASIATVIACACEKMTMTQSSWFMIHNAWTMMQGDSNDLRKEADLMDKMNDSIMTFYLSKFDATREQLKSWMDEETWIMGSEAKTYGLHVEVLPDVSEFKYAAMLKNMHFNKLPKMFKEINMEENETTQQEVAAEVAATEEVVHEEVVEQPAPEQPEAKVEEQMVPMAECEKRVSGMQSTMAKKLDALKLDYEAKIQDFSNQLKTKDEELNKAKAEVISLKDSLEKTAKELSEKTSALVEKEDALAQLNANVNTPVENAVNWRNLKGKAFFDWLKAHPNGN